MSPNHPNHPNHPNRDESTSNRPDRPVTVLSSMVDTERGLVSPEIFADEELYRLEQTRLFLRSWLFLAHESQLPRSGDFLTTFMGEDPVLVARQPDGSLRAMLNACRHRGMTVCRADLGNAKSFTCTYHGWSYDGSGRLINVPEHDTGYNGELDLEQWGLVAVARVETYKGLVFATFSPEAPPLVDYLGDMAWYLDCLVDRRAGGTEALGGMYKIRLRGNWKLAAEQFVGDNYHAGLTHASAFRAWSGPRDVTRAPEPGPAPAGRQFSSRLGHGTAGFYLEEAGAAAVRRGRGPDADLLARYHEQILPEVRNRLGVERAGGAASTAATIFPNCSYLANIFGSSSLGVWHPKGTDRFESWRIGLVDAAAPDEVKAATARMLHVWPVGLADADDGENWGGIAVNLRGPMVRRQAFNFQMGLGHERDDDPVYPGRIGPRWVGELPQRGFYQRWLEFMTSEGWPHLGLESPRQ